MKISVITVCYNSENSIRQTINSVLEQTHNDIEYIIIDGNSKDKTKEIIFQYKNFLNNIVSEDDKGIYDAINKGIKLSNGEIISILHSDDIFYNKDVCKNVSEYFKSNQTCNILSGITLINSKSNNRIRKYNPKYFKKWMMYIGVSPPHPSTFIKKKVYDEYGLYNVNYKIAGDFEFFLRMFIKENLKINTLDQNYVVMKSGGKSSSSLKSNLTSSKEIFKSFKENKLYTNWFFILMRFPFKIFQYLVK